MFITRIALALTLFSYASAPAVTSPSPVLVKATQMMSKARNVRYQHETDIEESVGRIHADCSGLVDYILQYVSPQAYRSLAAFTQKEDPGAARPLAKHFVEHFDRKLGQPSGWRPVRRVRELKQGDLIAWLTPDDSDSKNTGHVMIVALPPRPAAGFPNETEIRVIDSTRSGHGGGDVRKPKGRTGLGTGVIHLVEDGNGEPYAYRWKGNESKRIYETKVRLARALR